MDAHKPHPDTIVTTSRPREPTLQRSLGRWDLTAIGINQVLGAAIFLIPSQIAAQIGNWSWIGFVLAGLASLSVALCFAEVGSRFDRTGGPYVYTRAAFGRFVAFEVGWMQWFTRVSSQASIVSGIALALGFYWPAMQTGWHRTTLIASITLALAWINVRGIRQSAWIVNAFTIGKLVPLAVFILVGVFFFSPKRLTTLPPIAPEQIATAGLLLIFTYGGFDVIGVPAGEAHDPRRHLPFAFICTILAVTLIMTLCQLIAMSAVPDIANTSTPLADAALALMGPIGAAMIGVGSVISMTGNNMGQILTGSRMLFALAEHGELPRFLSVIHPRYRTPSNAVWFTTTVALGLALSGSFVFLAVVSAVARLVTYAGVAGATLELRRRKHAGAVQAPSYTVPFGPIVPVLALLVSLAILGGASRQQLLGGALALVAGALLFLARNLGSRAAARSSK